MKESLKKLWSHLPRNKPAFFFAAFFVVYGFLNISPIWWLKCVFGPFGLYAEYEAQWVWGYAMALKKRQKDQKEKTWGWWAAFNIIYILLLALPTGAGLFITEIATQEVKIGMVERINNNHQAYIENLQEQIRTKNRDLTTEFNKYGGNGANYKSMQRDLDRLNSDLKEALNAPLITSESVEAIKKDMFTNVSDLIGVPKQWIIGLMLTASLLMVYVGLWKKPMVVELDDEEDFKEEDFKAEITDAEPKKQELVGVCDPIRIVPDKIPENVILFESRKPAPVWNYPEIPDNAPVLPKVCEEIQYKSENNSHPENIPHIVNNDEILTESQTLNALSKLTPEEIPQLLEYIDVLYGDANDQIIGADGVELNTLEDCAKKLGCTIYVCRKFNGVLRAMGVVASARGIPSLGFWPKSRIIEYIKENTKGE